MNEVARDVVISGDISLKEYESCIAVLSAEEVALLRREFGERMSLAPTGTPGLYHLQAQQFVGFIVMPSNRVVEIRPKVPVDVLFAMLCKAHRLADFSIESKTYATVPEMFEFVVSFFTGLVEDLAAEGILRDFVPAEEELVALRGKVLLAETIRKRPAVRLHHWCRFVDFTADVPENQILKLACQALHPFNYKLIPILNSRLHRLLRLFRDVSTEHGAEQLFSRLVYHRLNEYYQPALSLARLLLAYLSPSGARGERTYQSFLVDMNALFERYVYVVLQEQLGGEEGLRIFRQDSRSLDFNNRVRVQPDVVLYGTDTPLVVLDTKYKLTHPNSDIYQVVAYCHAFHTSRAVLVYPLSEIEAAARIQIRPTPQLEIAVLSLDLTGDIAALQEQTEEFVRKVWREANMVLDSSFT